jgi:hypothetical protein
MLYLVALIVPPLAVLLCGKPFQAFINFLIFSTLLVFALLTLPIALPICVIHALFVVHNYYADQRNERLMRAFERVGDTSALAARDLSLLQLADASRLAAAAGDTSPRSNGDGKPVSEGPRTYRQSPGH